MDNTKRISIFGYGVTTTPLVAFLNQNGYILSIYDDKFVESSHDSAGNALLPPSAFKPDSSDMEIVSPGIAPTHPLIQRAKHLISEYDYFETLLDSRHKPFMVWISGTNGKTTTTEMTTMLLESRGAKSGGNIGTPLATLYADMQDSSIWVLETSSFALHYTKVARPRIYALLPLSEDHISWHGSFEAYVESKLSPLARMDSDSIAIVPKALSNHILVKGYKGKIILYANSADLAKVCGVEMALIKFKEPFLLDALIALNIAREGFSAESIELLNRFKIGAHRIAESYDSLNRLWVDDSKGTNVDATIQAVLRYKHLHIMIILGGDDKGAELKPLFEAMKGLDIAIFAIGSNESRLIEYAKAYNIPLTPCGTLENAMAHIHALRPKIKQDRLTDVVLLSPAAASLDQFSSYKERGEAFIRLALDEKR